MSVVYKMGIAAHFGLTKFYLKIVEIYTFCNFLGGSKKGNKTCKFHQFLSKILESKMCCYLHILYTTNLEEKTKK